ncbi:MAG: hypothetical protein ACN6QC_32695, partial [Paraburkholderia hospita]
MRCIVALLARSRSVTLYACSIVVWFGFRFSLSLASGRDFAARADWCLPLLRGHLPLAFCVLAAPVGVSAFALASAYCLRASSVAPVRGGTYFS